MSIVFVVACLVFSACATSRPSTDHDEVEVSEQLSAGYDYSAVLEESSKRESAAAQPRLDRIRRELASAACPVWAGSYAFDNESRCGTCVRWQSVELAPRSGVVWKDSFGGEPASTRQGEIVSAGDEKFVVRWAVASGIDDEAAFEDVFFVRWGPRTFLVPRGDMESFCQGFHERYDANLIEAPWRDAPDAPPPELDAESRRAPIRFDGVPRVPAEFAAWIFAEPRRARAIAAGPIVERPHPNRQFVSSERTLTLDAGSAAGLRSGVRLYSTAKDGHPFFSGVVIEVEAQRATVKCEYDGASSEWETPPDVGAEFSTILPEWLRSTHPF
jgi:hypothetical protein